MTVHHTFTKNLDEKCGCGHPKWGHDDNFDDDGRDGVCMAACMAAYCHCKGFHEPDDQDGGEV